jgi:hypothetical protein
MDWWRETWRGWIDDGELKEVKVGWISGGKNGGGGRRLEQMR